MDASESLPRRAEESLSLLVSLSALFTGIVFAATVVFSLFIPGTGGFFNIGESGVYLAALVGGSYVGAIAGGVGSMLADLFLGYPAWAPGTLVIKGVEGLVVGYLAYARPFRRLFANRWVSALVSLPLAAVLFLLGNTFYVGPADLEILGVSLSAQIVPALWGTIAILLVAAIVSLAWTNPSQTALIVAMAVGGSLMMLGYFLYGQFILEVGALLEVPFNAAQALVGMVAATYLYRAYRRIFPD